MLSANNEQSRQALIAAIIREDLQIPEGTIEFKFTLGNYPARTVITCIGEYGTHLHQYALNYRIYEHGVQGIPMCQIRKKIKEYIVHEVKKQTKVNMMKQYDTVFNAEPQTRSPFADIGLGNGFMNGGRYFIKTGNDSAFNLSDKVPVSAYSTQIVQPVKLVIGVE